MQFNPSDLEGGAFGDNVNSLRGTMFYICQGHCLCGTTTGNNRGKVIYCYGDLVPRQGELFSDDKNGNGKNTPRDLLAAQLGIWVFGLIALLIVLLLIRKSISSLRKHIEKVTERLPWYHDDDDILSNHSTATSPHIHGKDTTLESMGNHYMDMRTATCSEDSQDPDKQGHPHSPSRDTHQQLRFYEPADVHRNSTSLHHHEEEESSIEQERSVSTVNPPLSLGTKRIKSTNRLRRLRIKGKDFKKGGEALRGKNVIEGYRVKGKELTRTLK